MTGVVVSVFSWPKNGIVHPAEIQRAARASGSRAAWARLRIIIFLSGILMSDLIYIVIFLDEIDSFRQ
jgi:hypothetical protein